MTEPDEKTEAECYGAEKKKSYHKPGLIIYGDIREITQAVGLMGSPDGITMTALF